MKGKVRFEEFAIARKSAEGKLGGHDAELGRI